jgi:capsid protein
MSKNNRNKHKNKNNQKNSIQVIPKETDSKVVRMSTDFTGSGGVYTPLFAVSFNGEKTLGSVGPIRNYRPNYEALRLRSWQSYYESEVAHSIINAYNKWVIGKGLKLQCEPLKDVLKLEGIEFDAHEFSKTVEARYLAWSKSKMSDYAGMKSKNKLSATSFKNADLGGDVLVILRYIDNCVKIQLVDASHVVSPAMGTEYFPQFLSNGNKILNGIEFLPSGEHAAYYVRDWQMNFTRVPAKNSMGLNCAFLYYGSEYRLDNVRGVPKLSNVLEKIATLERYAAAALGSAEERQKIAYVMEPELMANPQNPLQKDMLKSYDYNKGISSQIPVDMEGKELANTIAATTNKQTFLMPPGIKMKSMDSKQEIHFKEFHSTNVEIICSCLGIPPNVAMMLYTESFSSSRAALKDWEHTLNVARDHFSTGFEQPIFNFWLETEILKNKIQAPGYIKAKMEGNYMVLEAYRSARFVGAPVPHIDPLKEVMAERAKLGDAGASLPMTTLEAATENLNGGESSANVQQFAAELENAKKLKIVVPEQTKIPFKEPKD